MRPSIAKIVWNDWVAFFSAVGVPMVWGIHFAFPYLRKGATAAPTLAAGLCALALTVVAWRIARVNALFISGSRAKGVITGVRIARDRGRLEYSFPVQGSTVESWYPVRKTRRVLALRVGEEVEILYDAREPRRAIVKELFQR